MFPPVCSLVGVGGALEMRCTVSQCGRAAPPDTKRHHPAFSKSRGLDVCSPSLSIPQGSTQVCLDNNSPK